MVRFMLRKMDDLRDLEQVGRAEGRRALRRDRIFRDRNNPLDMYDDVDFRQRFRLTRGTVLKLIAHIEDLEPLRQTVGAVPLHLQVLLGLRFSATGSFQRVCGDLFGVSPSTACCIVNRVTTAIARRKQQYLSFPQDGAIARIKQSFFLHYNMAGIINNNNIVI